MKQNLERNTCVPYLPSAMAAACLLAGVLLLSSPTAGRAQTRFTNTAGGNWSVAVNWNPNTVPDGSGVSALLFSTSLNKNAAVTNDTPHTVGSLSIYPNGKVVTFVGTTLTMDNGASKPTITMSQPGPAATGFSVGVPLAGVNGVRTPNKYNTITFSATNTYSGDTEIESGTGGGPVVSGRLKIGDPNTIPHGVGKGNVTLSDSTGLGYPDGILDLNGNSITINGLSGGDGLAANGGNGWVTNSGSGTVTLTVGDNDATSQFGGFISTGGNGGDIALVKIGAGTLTLTNANHSYSGGTTVNGGTLVVNGTSGSQPGTVVVNSGGTLLGNGTILCATTVASGGSIGAGTSAGLMTLIDGLDLSGGGTNIWELAALKDDATGTAGTDFDQLALVSGGNLALGGPSTLSIRFIGSATAPDANVAFWQSAHHWTVISVGGGAGNSGNSNFGSVQNGSYAAGNFTTAVDGATGSIVLTFTPSVVPPPTYPRITFISGGGPGSVTVHYTNTLNGTNYTLFYYTNVATTNKFTVGSHTAPGTSDSQVDGPAPAVPRFYRVYYTR